MAVKSAMWKLNALEMILLYVEEGRKLVNLKCADLEPWQIIGATILSTLGAVWVKGILFQPESPMPPIKERSFQLIRKIPFIGTTIDTQLNKALDYIRW